MRHGTRVAAVMAATALMMTAAVTGVTMISSYAQSPTTVASATVTPPDAAAPLTAVPTVTDILQRTPATLPDLSPLTDDVPAATTAGTQTTRAATVQVVQPAPTVIESDDHQRESEGHAGQDD